MKMTVTLEVEVEGTETESEARATAVGLVTPLLSEKKKGRPSSGPRATVVGFHVNAPMRPDWVKSDVVRDYLADQKEACKADVTG